MILDRLLYRDALILVIDKPAGLPVHKGPKGGETLTDHLDELRFGLPRRPEIAHRLDKETSGCLILGRHAKALSQLGDLFKNNKIDKTYLAIVEGRPEADAGTINMPLMKRSPERGWWMKPDEAGQEAITHWKVITRFAQKTLLELRPVTGRTHQLRVHCASQGWPIKGDAIYGNGERFSNERLYLHASQVIVPLYRNKEPIVVKASLPWQENMF